MIELNEQKDTAALEGEGRWVDIRGQNGKPMPIKDVEGKVVRNARMQIFGTYSKVFVEKRDAIEERNRENPKPRTAEQEREDNREQWSAAIGEWDLLIDGKRADPVAVFTRRPEIYAQVIEVATDHVGFFGAQSSN